MFSLKDLDVTKLADVPYEFEVIDEITGKGTGVFLSVIGDHSQSILERIQRHENDQRIADAMQAKTDPRGKLVHVVKFEDDVRYSTELVALRVKAWRGITEPYSPEAAIELCSINPPIKEQILACSRDVKKFSTPFMTKPVSTSDTPPG